MTASAHLVLIETAGNQAYIFATNKLRENVGASEIVYRIGTQLVLEAVASQTERPNPWNPEVPRAPGAGDVPPPHPRALAAWLCDETKNPPIEDQGEDGVEVVVATSGKALLLVKDRAVGKDIVAKVTRRALEEAPGAVVRGYVSKTGAPLDGFEGPSSAEALHKLVKEVHEGIERLRAELPAPEARFATLPVVAPCATSGLPAEGVFDYWRDEKVAEDQQADRPDPDDCAAPIRAKRESRKAGWRRIRKLAGEDDAPNEAPENGASKKSRRLAPDLSWLEDMDLDWHAVVHADGNGIGGIFLGFLKFSGANTARRYVNAYREFSCSLELCTLAAFDRALDTLERRPIRLKKSGRTEEFLPIVPLVLGGDDLTVVCDGASAVDFAAEFLRAFEQWSGVDSIDGFTSNIPQIAKAGRLSACAGVAVVKPHFPFHRAYELAEGLLRSAKSVKDRVKGWDEATQREVPIPCSALDFHVHFDSSGADLEAIREGQEAPNARLYAKPYVVTTLGDDVPATGAGRAWVETRLWEGDMRLPKPARRRSGISDAAAALTRRARESVERLQGERSADAQEAGLPRNQQHYLREGLFLGRDAADARLRQIAHRYADFEWQALHPKRNDKSVFFLDQADEDENKKRIESGKRKIKRTWLFDALELAELRGPEREPAQAAAGAPPKETEAEGARS